jgi:hypothetical protein
MFDAERIERLSDNAPRGVVRDYCQQAKAPELFGLGGVGLRQASLGEFAGEPKVRALS